MQISEASPDVSNTLFRTHDKKKCHSCSHPCRGCWVLLFEPRVPQGLSWKWSHPPFALSPYHPLPGAWGGQMSQELLHCLWHIFPTALKSCSPASNTESFNIVPPSTFSPSESRFQPHCQFRRLSIRITKRSTWLVFLGKWNSLLRWTVEISFSCQTEVAHLELLNDRFLSFF